MNFLAHLYLSGSSDDIRIGNFIGDFVKGNKYNEYPEEIRSGILIHREIDRYTDQHPLSKDVRHILSPYFRHYSGVVQDLYWDHFLAKHWNDYHPQPLEVFIQECFSLLMKKIEELPSGVQRMLPYMVQDNWLLSYAEMEGISQALNGISRRTRFESNMEKGGDVLRAHYDELFDIFKRFMPDIQQFTSGINPYFILPQDPD